MLESISNILIFYSKRDIENIMMLMIKDLFLGKRKKPANHPERHTVNLSAVTNKILIDLK